MKSWFEIRAVGKSASIAIYDVIGQGGVTAQSFINQLSSFKDIAVINLNLSSEGGSVSDGIAIYNALKGHPAKVNVFIGGWALSMGSFIAMAGDYVEMAENSLMMIHNAWGIASGDANELRKVADVYEMATKTMINGYAAKSKKSTEEIKNLLDAETWFTAQDALSNGFIDSVSPSVQMAATLDIGKFNPPEKMKGFIMQQQSNSINTQDNQASSILSTDLLRRQSIRQSFAKFQDNDGAKALQQACEDDPKCTVEVANQRLLQVLGQGSSPIAGNYFLSTDDTRERDFVAAVRDSFLIRAGLRVVEPSPMAQDVQRLGILGVAERMLSMRGQSLVGKSRADIIKAVHTTSDFTLLLANTAGKALRLGYENESGSHTIWTAEKEVADFKKQSMVALSEAPNLLEVPEGSEYKSGSFGESAEEFAVKTYGRVFEITRQALINDDIGAFTSLPAAFGGAARRLEADLVYEKLLSTKNLSDGKQLFHADHGNLAPSGAALSLTSLGLARAAMRKQKGIKGVQYLDPVPRFLIVPVALETVAEQLISSLVDPSKSNDTTNVQWVRNLTVVADPRLDSSSETTWYLAASPMQVEGIVRAYLSGQVRPYYEVEEQFNRDVTTIKSRIDVTVGTIDYRALYKNPGA